MIKRPHYGVDKVLDGIEEILLNSKYLHNRFYMSWLGLKSSDRAKVREEIRKVIRRELLGKEWWLALSKDVIKVNDKGDIYVETESEVYKYLKRVLFRYKGREMLIMLRDVREEL